MKEASRKIKPEDMAVINRDNIDSFSDDELRAYVKNQIENARDPNPQMLRDLPTMNRRKLIESVWNFFLKGENFGVIR